jgi:hypothetical protein
MKSWYIITMESFQDLLQGFIGYLPKIIGALAVVIIGWFVAVFIGKIVTEVLRRIKFDTLFEKGVWKHALEKAEWKIDPSGFIGAIVKWVLFVSVLIAAVQILGFVQFAIFVGQIAAWLPNIIVAAAIFVVAVIVADYFPKIIRAGVEGLEIKYSSLLETIARGAIWIFAVLAILIQLGIAEELIMTLFTGFVAFLVIAGGLAFGLGGKDFAAEFLEDMKKKMKEKE